jgi:hypothetical protein
MEYIHKKKAEKARSKMLTDQVRFYENISSVIYEQNFIPLDVSL